MASFSNTIKTTIDVVSSGATASVKSFKQSINDAEGASGKLKAGFGATGDFIKSHAAGVAMAAGTALVGFAVKAVGEFQNLALETGKMSDTLGIAAEDASKWIEVAGDIGASGEDVTKAMSKMEKAVAATPAAFESLGIEVARTKDGTVDANETFIRTVEALKKIKDPTERQAAANKLLGKSWSSIAEIVNGDVRSALASVSDAKIIDAGEVERARDFRDSMDELKGKLEDLTITVGSELVPVLTDAVGFLTDMGEAAGGVSGFFSDLADDIYDVVPGLDGSNEAIDELIKKAKESAAPLQAQADRMQGVADAASAGKTPLGEAADGVEDVGDAADVARSQVDQFRSGWDKLMGKFSNEAAFNAMVDSFDDIQTAAEEAYAAASEGGDEAEAANKRLRDAVLSNKEAVSSYLMEVLKIPPSKATEIIAKLEQGKYDEVQSDLAQLTMGRSVWIEPKLTKSNLIVGLDVQGAKTGVRYGATGGIVTKPTLAVIGEAGPEMVVPMNAGPLSGAPGASPLSGGGGGVTINLTVNAGMGVDPALVGRQIKDVLNRTLRQEGKSML